MITKERTVTDKVWSVVEELQLFHKITGILHGHTRDVLFNIASVYVTNCNPKNKKIRDLVHLIREHVKNAKI